MVDITNIENKAQFKKDIFSELTTKAHAAIDDSKDAYAAELFGDNSIEDEDE